MIRERFADFTRSGAAEIAKGYRELLGALVRRIGMNTHSSAQSLLPLEETPQDDRTFLNASVWFVDSDGYRVVFRWHEPIYRVALNDEVHLRLVAVAIRQSGLATQEEICQAFGHTVSTQARWERQYRKHALDGLTSKKPSGRSRELDKSQEGVVRRGFRAGCSNRQMAKQLGVDETTIRRTLKRLGLARTAAAVSRLLPPIEDHAPEVAAVPTGVSVPTTMVESFGDVPAEKLSPVVVPAAPSSERREPDAVAPVVAAPFTLDCDPRDRSGDRFLARVGLLEDAAPLTEARGEANRLESELGKEAAANHEATRPTMRGFKIAHAGLRGQLQKVEAKIERLLEQRRKTPKRIPASDMKRLKTEKKLIADVIKMAAYQVETQLLGMLQDHYARADEEGRTLLHAAFQSSARLEVTEDELRVTIGRQSSPHRTAALAALCQQLDSLATPFPGTHLRLRLAVQAPEPVIS
ncbi:MAG: putative transposase [Thermoguttaceae bacterium]